MKNKNFPRYAEKVLLWALMISLYSMGFSQNDYPKTVLNFCIGIGSNYGGMLGINEPLYTRPLLTVVPKNDMPLPKAMHLFVVYVC